MTFNSSVYNINDSLYKRIYGKSLKKDADIDINSLRYINVSYYGFDACPHTGELIVSKTLANKMITIFKELFDKKYPIEKMRLIDDYDGDDNASMADNNTSCFNYRTIDHSSQLSKHSFGFAIDINPLYNPYIKTVYNALKILPPEGNKYTDRTLNCPYMIRKNDVCYNTFIRYGFSWGGEWINRKDYQHFEIEK